MTRPGRAGPVFAKRSLGQNFLRDQGTARRIAALLEIGPGDLVLEIGPGQGALTRHLLAAGPAACLALEKDGRLAAALKEAYPALAVAVADALEAAWERLRPERPWKVAGNLPFNVASPLMWEVFSRARGLERAVFMVQKEVGLRLSARAGSRTYGALSVWIQSFVVPRLEFLVGPGVFLPRPKVDSAVLTFRPRPGVEQFSPQALSGLLRTCFQKRRKQLSNILRSYWNDDVEAWFAQAGAQGSMRPEDLTPEQFRALSTVLRNRFTS